MRVSTGARIGGKARTARPYFPKRGRPDRPYVIFPWGSASKPKSYMPAVRKPRYGPTFKYNANKKPRRIVSHPGNGSTNSYFTSGRKNMSRAQADLFKQNQDYQVTTLTSQRLDSNVFGRQYVGEEIFMPAFVNFTADINRVVPGITTDERQSSSLEYGTMKVVSTFTNCELTTSYLQIYEIEPRFHQSATASPALYWQIGLQRQTSTTSDFYQYVYETPFKSQQFCLYYKVNKTINVELAAGQSHKHTSTYYLNKRMYGILAASGSTHGTLRDFTKFQMYVASGTPINDAATPGNVSTSTVAIDVVNSTTYNYTYAAQTRTKYVMTDGLDAIVGTPNVITQYTRLADTEA